MKNKKYLSFFSACILSASLLSGCSGGVTYDKKLVGDGEVFDNVESLTKLDDKKSDTILGAINKKYNSVEIKSVDTELSILCDMNFTSADADGMKMNFSMNIEDELLYEKSQDLLYQKIKGKVSLFGMEVPMDIESYTEKSEDDIISYSKTSISNKDAEWKKKVNNNKRAKEDNEKMTISFNPEYVNGVYLDQKNKSYVLDIDSSIFEPFEGVLTEDVLADKLDVSNDLFKMDTSLDNLRIYISLDDGLGLTGFYIDFSDMYDLSDGKTKINIKDFYVLGKFNAINEKLDIKIPNAAKESEDEDGEPETENTMINEIFSKKEPVETEYTTQEAEPANQAAKPVTQATEPTIQTAESVIQATEPVISTLQSDVSIKINGTVVQIPGSASVLNKNNFKSQEIVSPGENGDIELTSTNKNEFVIINVHNDSDTAKEASECTIYSIYADTYKDMSSIISINGLSYGDTTESVKQTFGNPSSVHESESLMRYSYDTNDYAMSFNFEESGLLIGFSFYIYEY